MGSNLPIWSPSLGDVVLTSALLQEILGGSGSDIVETAITTVGAGTLTAAALVGGQIARTGPTAAFTDTTATAAAIVTALGAEFTSGQTFIIRVKNATGFEETINGGTGVTMPTNNIAGPFQVSMFFGTVGGTSASPTVTFTHMSTTSIESGSTYLSTATQTANANVVPATIPGLSAPVQVGTYKFRAALQCTVASGTGGIAINQLLTTAVLGAGVLTSVAALAAGVATQQTTTVTSGTVLFSAADQPLLITIEGTFTVTTAGTFALQMCQAVSNASNSSVLVNSYMELSRIG